MFALSVNVCEISNDCYPELQNGLMPHVNMPMERPHMTFYLLAQAMVTMSVITCEILTIKMCITLTLTFRMGQAYMYMCQWKDPM